MQAEVVGPVAGPGGNVTLVVLAGGEGRRMGGADKGLQVFRGRPLIEHVFDRVAPQTAAVLISANRNRAAYQAYGHPVVGDGRPGYAGPLAGIEAALGVVRTPWALVVPCDVPLLPVELLARLAAAVGDAVAAADPALSPAPAAVACAGGRRHAVLVLPVGARTTVVRLLDAGEHRVQALLAALAAVEVGFDDCAEAFANFNTLQSLAGR